MKFNKVKKYIQRSFFATVCLSSLMFSSCDKFLDVRPVGELPGDQILVNATGFENALYGVYGTLASENLYGRNLSHDFIELLAQYFDCFGNNYVTNATAFNYTNSTIEETVNNVWGNMYTNISNVNNILINLEKYSSQSFPHYNIYKGEALGLRAFMHFDLLRLFSEHIEGNTSANGIPYSKSFSLKATPFSKASEVYTLIISDLLEAEQLLADDVKYFTYPKTNASHSFLKDREIHFNLYAVKALLARVYLTKGDKINAAKYAKEVIDANKFSLLGQSEVSAGIYRGVLYPKESIFGLFSANYFEVVRNRFYISTSFFSYNNRSDLADKYLSERQGVDYRYVGFFRQPSNSNSTVRFVKLVDQYQVDGNVYSRNQSYVTGVNLIRLPEMYYILAECLLDSNIDQATQYFDTVLKSRGLTGLAERVPAVELTLERINTERYKEFIGEGQTFYNMKRFNQDIIKSDRTVITASNGVYVWPIPVDEKEFNN